MIHTLTISHKVFGTETIKRIAESIGCSRKRMAAFMQWTDDSGKKKGDTIKCVRPSPGFLEIAFSHTMQWIKSLNKDLHTYNIYIKLEPLTVITREKHIALFECTPENLQRLQDNFRTDMLAFLDAAENDTGEISD